ncbi:MAG: HAMP domain-containing sensor histidine kinase [Betaproteobacteria bacterium]|nr:HAMP domain-containing sensor histidine kinase [Betaproteobacteria bacterium]
MDVIGWFVPPDALDDPRKNTRHRGIAKAMLTISLVVSLMLIGMIVVRATMPTAEYALFAAGIITPIFGALLIRVTGDISLGLVLTNIGGILIIGVWAFLSGGINSIVLPGFLANLALQSTFGNTAILLVTGALLAAALVFLYAATVLDWLPVNMITDAEMPGLMLTAMLGSVGMVVLAGVTAARDRSTVKRLLRSAQQAAEQSSSAKTVFLTSVSNEFRTPLIAIRELVEKLRSEKARPLSSEQLASVEHIATAGEHLLGLVTQVLEMSRIESGELRVNMEPVRCTDLILPCLALMEIEARAKRIHLIDNGSATTGWVVWADRVLIKKVLLNLISNAIAFNRPDGSVTISCERRGTAYLRISVADTGPGVSPERRNDLFEPFSRLGAESGSVQGAGLSLAISKQLMHRMHGKIGFESAEGVGSTFWVELPLAETHTTQS